MNEKINILGTEYEISISSKPEERDADGLCVPYSKRLIISPPDSITDELETNKGKGKAFKEAIRHEVIHAFFFESGLPELYANEEVVNWIAIQFPKMQRIFEKLGAEE